MTAAAEPLSSMPSARPLLGRVQAILLTPRTEWPAIAGEHVTTAGLYARYIAPLAAIPPAAALIGTSVFGIRLPFGGTYRVPFGSAAMSACIQYVLALGAVYGLALIIDALAPTFEGERNRVQALKVAAYASTASWIVGIVALIPALAVLTILGLYSLYLIYLGLPVLMKAPAHRATGYAVAVIVCAVVVFMAAGLIATRFVAYPSLSLPVR